MWDKIQIDFITKQGATITDGGIIEIPRREWAKQAYRGVNAETGVRQWMIPSIMGCCLIFEHLHFEII